MSQVSWKKRLADIINRQNTKPSSSESGVSREAKILSQVEFYFSDSNLRRDKFMHALFAEDLLGWISLKELCGFPILKKLKVGQDELLHAIRRSDFFVVDRPQARIRRDFNRHPNQEIEEQLKRKSVEPPKAPSAVEKRTIYLENLPLNIDHDRVRNEIVSQFPRTEVKYVSVPRHPVTGESFGCAFVEFGCEEEAAYVAKKLHRVETEKFDAVSGKLGREVRVLSLPKYKILKKEYMRAKSLAPENRLSYHESFGIAIPQSETIDEDRGSESSSTSSVLVDSDINSLAQDSVEVRRARNASSIRSNSMVLISGLPKTSSVNVRVWLSHSCAVQFLDHKDNATEAYVRLASRREREFFIIDYDRSKLRILGELPTVRALTEEECLDYFDNERERRRAQCLAMGPPESWESSKPKRQRTEGACAKTALKVVGKVGTGSAAFTDTIAGNAKEGEPGSSMLYGIEKGRHVARRFFNEGTSGTSQSSKRRRVETEAKSEPVRLKKTRRGTRGGKRISS
jgi:RNA recognition motif-containing protein